MSWAYSEKLLPVRCWCGIQEPRWCPIEMLASSHHAQDAPSKQWMPGGWSMSKCQLQNGYTLGGLGGVLLYVPGTSHMLPWCRVEQCSGWDLEMRVSCHEEVDKLRVRNDVYRAITFCDPFTIWVLFDMMSERMGISSLYSPELRGWVCTMRVGDGVFVLDEQKNWRYYHSGWHLAPHSSLSGPHLHQSSTLHGARDWQLKTCCLCLDSAESPWSRSCSSSCGTCEEVGDAAIVYLDGDIWFEKRIDWDLQVFFAAAEDWNQ